MSLNGTYHRRELNPPAIPFCDRQGRELFKESLDDGLLESYFPLSEQFTTQSHPAFCGIGSLTMALNSLLLDPQRVWQGIWRWFDESMLDCCVSHEVIKLKGITIPKLACLARCNGAEATLKYATEVTMEEFRQDIIRVSSQAIDDMKREVIIVAYNRPVVNQTGSGHYSPIGGYNRRSDMVLIMDVARFKYPPHWIPLELLYDAMKSIDQETNKSRGYILISRSSSEPGISANCLCQEDIARDESDPLAVTVSGLSIRIEEADDGEITLTPRSDGIDAQNQLLDIVNHRCKFCQ
jgi:glutathione gamma-glutamylcysteinyltransferase